MVLLLPVVDVLTIFPLVSIGLSDNILTYIYKDPNNISLKPYLVARLLCSVPPVIISFFVYDLSFIANFLGTFTILYLMTFIPAICLATMKLLPTKGPYDD